MRRKPKTSRFVMDRGPSFLREGCPRWTPLGQRRGRGVHPLLGLGMSSSEDPKRIGVRRSVAEYRLQRQLQKCNQGPVAAPDLRAKQVLADLEQPPLELRYTIVFSIRANFLPGGKLSQALGVGGDLGAHVSQLLNQVIELQRLAFDRSAPRIRRVRDEIPVEQLVIIQFSEQCVD